MRHASTQDQYIAAVREDMQTLPRSTGAVHAWQSWCVRWAQIHFAMTTMSTVGYGDVSPKSRTERLVAMVIMAVGELPI